MFYNPVESLREEVERFFETNQYDPLLVTNFYAQARVVLNYVDELESELKGFIDHGVRIEKNVESSRRLLRRKYYE